MAKSVLCLDIRCICVLLLLSHQTIQIVGTIRGAQLRHILVQRVPPSLVQQLLTSSNSLFRTNYGKMLPNKDNNNVVGPYRRRTYNMIAKIVTGNPYMHHSRDIYKKTSIFPRQPFWTFGTH